MQKRHFWHKTLILFLAMTSLAACTNDAIVSNKYASLRARFTYTPVSAVSQLYTACNSLGEWTSIRAVNMQFVFQNTSSSTAVNRTAVNNYQSYVCLSGFIVGLPTIPEIGADVPTITCYDLACSNCFRDRNVTKALTLQQTGKAYCTSCQRTYDLNNMGQVSKGEGGINLFRYRVYYGNNTLTINNQ